LAVSGVSSNGVKRAAANGRLKPLPRGRHDLPPELIAQNQHERMIAGLAKALSEHGYAHLTITHVVGAAGVSRETFYKHFKSKQDAVLAAHEAAFERLLYLVLRACNAQSEWPLKVKAAISAALHFAATEPDRARLLTLDALAFDTAVRRHIVASRNHLAALLDAGRDHSSQGFPIPQITERALVGGIAAIIAARLSDGAPAELLGLEPQLVELVLVHYLGAQEAARVARCELVGVNGSDPVLQP
jgi:AcrR family transcriptional regulator